MRGVSNKHCLLTFFINPLYSDGFTHTDKCNKVGIVHYIYPGVTGRNFQKNVVLQSPRIVFILGKCADPDEMPHLA